MAVSLPIKSTLTENHLLDLQKMRKVTVDKSSKTVTAQGGCTAADVEQPAEAEDLSVVFGVVNETGKCSNFHLVRTNQDD